MEKIKYPVLLVTAFAFLYQFTPFLGASEKLIFALFLLSPLVVIWLVYKVLKDGKPSRFTWDEKFYDDSDYMRVGKE
jgi:hypothetical protein